MRDLGASEEQIAERIAALGSQETSHYFEVWSENWLSFEVFCNLSRCWRIDGMNGVYLGLERPAIESTLRLMGVKHDQQTGVFNDLLVMEGAALAVLNKA